MSERDLPKNGDHDPVDDAYRRAEALLNDDCLADIKGANCTCNA